MFRAVANNNYKSRNYLHFSNPYAYAAQPEEVSLCKKFEKY